MADFKFTDKRLVSGKGGRGGEVERMGRWKKWRRRGGKGCLQYIREDLLDPRLAVG